MLLGRLLWGVAAAWQVLVVVGAGGRRARARRQVALLPPLVYPFGSTLKLLVGCAVPVAMPGRVLVHAQNIQFQYSLPANASLFADYFVGRRRRRQVDGGRAGLFRFLEAELTRRGGPGVECLKRSVCEAAEAPLGDEGLLGEILHVLLTPDYGDSGQVAEEEYLRAAEVGRRGADCLSAYPRCPHGFGLLDHIWKVSGAERPLAL